MPGQGMTAEKQENVRLSASLKMDNKDTYFPSENALDADEGKESERLDEKTAYNDDEKNDYNDVTSTYDDVSCNCDTESCDCDSAHGRESCWRDFCGYKLVILFCSFMCYFIFCGICYTVSIYYVAWMEDFEAGSGITSWLGSTHIGVLCGVAPIASALTDRFGFRPVVMAGGVIATAGLIGTVFAKSIYTLLFTFSIITPIGSGLAYVPSSTIVSIYFDRGRVLANSIFTSGAGLGNFVLAYVLGAAIEAFHWRGSMFISACATLQLCVLGALMREPESWKEIKRQHKLKTKGSNSVNFLSGFHIYRSLGLVLYFIQMMMTAAGFSIVFVHVTAITEALAGVSRTRATLAISLIGLSSIFGRLVTGFLGQNKNVDMFLYYIVCMTCSGLSAILVPFLSIYPCIITWAVVYGFLCSSNVGLQQIMMLHFVDLADLNTAFAHNAVFVAIGYILGAPIAGWLFDYTRDYSGSFFLGGSFITLGSILLIPPYIKHKREAKLTTVKIDERLKHVMATSFGSIIGSQYLEAIQSHDELRRSRLDRVHCSHDSDSQSRLGWSTSISRNRLGISPNTSRRLGLSPNNSRGLRDSRSTIGSNQNISSSTKLGVSPLCDSRNNGNDY